MYSQVLTLVILSFLLIIIAANTSNRLLAKILHPDTLTLYQTFTNNQKLLGFGTALLVIFISASSLGPIRLSSLPKRLYSIMTEYKPFMLNRNWNPNQARHQRSSRESRFAVKNGGEIGGLGNEGNTCFMNSVLQALASSDSLLKFFDEHIYEETEVHANGEIAKVRTSSEKPSMKFTAALKHLLDDLNGKYGSRGKEFSTRVLLKKMPDGPKQNFFMGYNQEDAQEFYQSVMRIVEKEYKTSDSTSSPSPQPEAKEATSKFVDADDLPGYVSGCDQLGRLGTVYVPAHQINPNVPDSENRLAPLDLVTPVDGITAERIGCITCGETGGIRYSVNSGLSLNLPYDRSYGTHYELLQLLKEWKKPELIDDVNCNRCGLIQTRAFLSESTDTSNIEKLVSTFTMRIEEIDLELKKDFISDEVFEKLTTKQMIRKTTKSKQILMSRPPPLLCIHINRSVIDPNTFMIMKNSKSVSFPAVLDLNDFVADPDNVNMDARLPFSKRDQHRTSSEHNLEAGNKSMSSGQVDVGERNPSLGDLSDNADGLVESDNKMFVQENENLRYQLKAVISHMGTHNYGHYICYRRWRGSWWKANDEAVYTTTEAEVLSSPGTFMLFYELAGTIEEDLQELSDFDAEDEKTVTSNSIGQNVSSSSSVVSDDEEDLEENTGSNTPQSEGIQNHLEEESQELFPNSEFRLGEERAYHV